MMIRGMALILSALVIPACGPGGDPPVPTATTTQRAFAQRLPGVAGLDNFARVNPTLYRGAQPTEEGFRQLKAMGIKTVIDFRSHHSTKAQVEAAGMTPVEIPLEADLMSVPPDDAALKKFFDVVLDPARQPVYIHCAFGKDRTGTMAAIYRLEVDHWTAEEALQEMEAFGYHNIYHALINYVRAYKPHGFVKEPAPR
jgi:protein tyrosine/serine phosphatase